MGNNVYLKNKIIGDNQPVYVIAEMSANHAGDINRAIEIIHAAKKAGADCIKIQTYTPDTITLDCNNKYFQIESGAWKGYNLYNLYKKAYTPWEWQLSLKQESEKIGIDFLSTVFDNSSVDFLESIGVDFYKIASFELVDIPLIKYTASKGKPILLSTGMASFEEIQEAVKTIQQFNIGFCLLKCSSTYPAIPEYMNLNTIKHLYDTFNIPIGLSDHSLGTTSAVVAVALGAKIIEKHFCISRDIENPDSFFSMEAEEFKRMVEEIRAAEASLGSISYTTAEEESKNKIFRKSIFIVKDVKKGDFLTEENIRVIRPAYGMEPKYYEQILGKKASIDIEKGTPLDFKMLE